MKCLISCSRYAEAILVFFVTIKEFCEVPQLELEFWRNLPITSSKLITLLPSPSPLLLGCGIQSIANLHFLSNIDPQIHTFNRQSKVPFQVLIAKCEIANTEFLLIIHSQELTPIYCNCSFIIFILVGVGTYIYISLTYSQNINR